MFSHLAIEAGEAAHARACHQAVARERRQPHGCAPTQHSRRAPRKISAEAPPREARRSKACGAAAQSGLTRYFSMMGHTVFRCTTHFRFVAVVGATIRVKQQGRQNMAKED